MYFSRSMIFWTIFAGRVDSIPPMIFWAFFALAIASAIWGIRQGYKQAQERRQALQALAPQIGFSFQGEDWNEPSPELDTALFNRGGGRRFRNIMTGECSGLKANLFDYSYVISNGKSSSTYTQTVAAFAPERSFPLFELRPEGFFDRVGDVFTHSDIDFDSNPEFSRRYMLRGEDREKVQALFTPSLLTFFEGLTPDEKWHVEGNGQSLIFYRAGVTVDASEITSFRDETAAMAQTFLKSGGILTA